MGSIWIHCILLIIGYVNLSTSLRLLQLVVPSITDYRDPVTLRCTFDLGSNKLNSVKWYKDGHEFYRYAPFMKPPVSTFEVAGVRLDSDDDGDDESRSPPDEECSQSECSVRLYDLRAPQSSGAYRCEVSGDAPAFQLVHRTSNMTVAALPRHDPEIGGLADSYSYGSRVLANCTTDRSSPVASISWFLNNMPVAAAQLGPQIELRPEIVDSFVLRSRTQEAVFAIDRGQLGDTDRLAVKCVATVDGHPRLLRERVHIARLTSDDRLNNDRLVNLKSSSKAATSLLDRTQLSYLRTLLPTLLLSAFLSGSPIRR